MKLTTSRNLITSSVAALLALGATSALAIPQATDNQTWNLNVGNAAPAFCSFDSIIPVELNYNAASGNFILGTPGDIVATTAKIVDIRIRNRDAEIFNGAELVGVAEDLQFTGTSALDNDSGAPLSTTTSFFGSASHSFDNSFDVTVGPAVGEVAISVAGVVTPPASYIPRDNDVLTMNFEVVCNS